MRLSNVVLFASTATALSFPDASVITSLFARKDGSSGSGSGSSGSGSGKCPAVWTSISKELTKKFLTRGECNPDARAAIRLIFHDCGAWNQAQGATGGCDGSLALNAEELGRGENKGLSGIANYVKDLAGRWGVGVADAIVFTGTHAIVTCPGGPRVKTYVGRTDSSTAAPNGLLPDVNAPAAELSQLFRDKGFDDVDLAALLGAHSTSNQFNFNTSADKVGLPQDSTPGVWDVKYYSETLKPPKGVVVFPSDTKLANYQGVGKEFKGFVGNAGKWNGKFADAMGKMALFGSSGTSGLTDCTDSLPKATSSKRDLKAMNPFKPRY
ncbi:class II peroxidase [Lentithecium fluviatile CBS 122367]|uniref:Peroxidase n=1 Tax=Lentithecium fluviatile CBS 122367 TaxID=1168545 RepID=A0A6G1IT70_9PLEO|nr:class II peroxidase [Lentithecium fluviatile CBS 122367]